MLICKKKSKHGHFVGSIVNIAKQAMPTGVQKYMIIDSQQRITTLTLLLIALRNYANKHTEDTVSRLLTNYEFFLSQIEKIELPPAEVYESIGKLQIVNITLDRAVDNAQAIFESLNSTGKELSESDLVRNYILMGLDNTEQSYV